MGNVSVSIDLHGFRASEAEELWYDTRRWPSFVDGLAHVAKVEPGWPQDPGARLVWDSKPSGRGRVIERVLSYEARRGQSADVEDEKMRGTQRVEFEPREQGVRVTLSLDYVIKREKGNKTAFDFLFVRRPTRDMLARTLHRFARELRSDRELA